MCVLPLQKEGKAMKPTFDSTFTKYLSDEELCKELNFACDHLRALIQEYTRRSLRGTRRAKVSYSNDSKTAKVAVQI